MEGTPARAACAATELGQVFRRGAGEPGEAEAAGGGERHRDDAVLEGRVGLAGIVLHPQRCVHADRSSASASARTNGVRPGLRLTRETGSWPTRGSSGAYATLFAGPASICARVHLRQNAGIVADLERAQNSCSSVLGAQRRLGATVTTDQNRAAEATMSSPFLIFPAELAAGVGTCRCAASLHARAVVAAASSGRSLCPLG